MGVLAGTLVATAAILLALALIHAYALGAARLGGLAPRAPAAVFPHGP